jgi:tetratricopeptide (TPR) repeat protein
MTVGVGVAFAAAGRAGAQTAGARPSLVLLPLQPAQSQIPAIVVQRLGEVLAEEVKKGGAVTIARYGGATGAAASAAEDQRLAGIREAEKEYAEGRDQYGKQSFHEAAKSFERALRLLEEHLAIVGDYGFLADVHLWHGLALFRSSNEDEANAALERALLVRPDLQIDPRKVDAPVFINLVERLRKRLRERARGSLVVTTAPAGCEILINGVLRGRTPVDLQNVPSGWHHVRVSCAGHVPAAKQVEVRPNAASSVSFTPVPATGARGAHAGPDPLPPLLSRLRQGIVNSDTLALAQEIALRAQADFALVGYFLSQGGDYVLRAYVYRTADGRLAALPAAKFDAELLAAAQEGPRVARAIEKSILSMPAVARRETVEVGVPSRGGPEIRSATDLARAESLLAGEEVERLAREERERRLGIAIGSGGARAQGEPFYRKWWFWTIVGAVVVGGVSGAALGASGGAGSASVGIRWTPP